jgi:hypothetical protein
VTEHLDDERLVAYWSSELAPAEVDAVDEHVFACERCAAASERFARLVRAIRAVLPVVIGRGEVDALRARGMQLRDNEFQPGERKAVRFERDVELLIHHLRGLQLADAERVDLAVRSERDGLVHREPYAPFDRERGEVLVACQRHFAAMPRDIAFDVSVHRRGVATPEVTTYFVPHEFE